MPILARGNLTSRIVHTLGSAIVSGEYSGEDVVLIESDISRTFSASRPVVREAMKMLAAKGLVSARPRQGTRVQAKESWNLLDPDVLQWLLEYNKTGALLQELSEVQLAIEPKAAALAAIVATPEQRKAIRHAVARIQAAGINGYDPLPFDTAFHVAILRASGNRFYAQLGRLVEIILQLNLYLRGLSRTAAIEANCVRIADAIFMGNARRAEASMTRLVKLYGNSAKSRGARSTEGDVAGCGGRHQPGKEEESLGRGCT